MLSRKLKALPLAMLLSGCGTIGSGTETMCVVFEPIYISREDVLTDLTAQQILQHNEVGKRVCDWGKK